MTETRRADIALVERGLFASRAKAREAIEAGLVTLDGRVVAKPSEPVAESAQLTASAPYPWVSRGGVKLAAALDAFAIDPSGKQALDIGASTGGFAHVLLTRGAAHVTCVDVGHGQLHPVIAGDSRVRSLEKRDARTLAATDLPSAAATRGLRRQFHFAVADPADGSGAGRAGSRSGAAHQAAIRGRAGFRRKKASSAMRRRKAALAKKSNRWSNISAGAFSA